MRAEADCAQNELFLDTVFGVLLDGRLMLRAYAADKLNAPARDCGADDLNEAAGAPPPTR
jgi:hypothetical protein